MFVAQWKNTVLVSIKQEVLLVAMYEKGVTP